MSAPLPDRDREKLAQVLGMLGSVHDGEVLAAARAADRLVQQHGLTWQDIVRPGATQRSLPTPASWRTMVALCLQRPGSLTAWETEFLHGLARFPRLSLEQRSILSKIADRVLDD